MNKYTTKKKTLAFCLFFIAVFLIPNLIINADADTYSALDCPQGYFNHALINGRPVHALSFAIIWLIGKYSIGAAYYYSILVSACLMILATYRYSVFLQTIFQEYKIDNGKLDCIKTAGLACVTIFNIFIIEYYMYPECDPMWIVPFWLNVEAIISYRKFINEKKYIEVVKIFVFLLISCFSYQIVEALFIVLTLPFILLRARDFKHFMVMEINVGILYAIPMFINMLFTKFVVSSPRINEASDTISQAVLEYVPPTIDTKQYILQRITFGMVAYVVLCVAVIILLSYMAVKKNEKIELLKGAYITIVTIVMGLLPFITLVSDNYKPRLYYPLGLLFGVLLTYGCLKGYIASNGYEKISIICSLIIVFYIFVQAFSFSEIYMERFATNYDDMMLAQLYGERIKRIEIENDVKIKEVSFYYDKSKTKYITNKGWCVSMRAFGIGWGEIGALNYYLGTEYAEGKRDPNLIEYFSNENWDSFSDEQVVYKDGLVHICCY